MDNTEPRVVTQVKHGMIWIGCFLLLAALIVTFLTQRSPISLVLGKNPKAQKEMVSVWQKEQTGLAQIAAVGDDRSTLGVVQKAESSTAVTVDSSAKIHQSTAIALHDSQLAWAGPGGFAYLHRTTRRLQTYDQLGVPRWELQLTAPPDYAWSSPDGHILVAQGDKGVTQRLILVSPDGKALWEHVVTNGVVISAAVANRGQGVALGVLNLNSASTQSIAYLLDNRGQVASVTDLGNMVTKGAGISQDGRVAVLAGQRKMVGIDTSGKKIWEVALKGDLLQLVVSPRGNYTVATVEKSSWFGLSKRSSIMAMDHRGKLQWQYALETRAIDLAVANDESVIIVGTPKSILGLRSNGDVVWGNGYRGQLVDLALSPSGRLVSGLDQNGKLLLWEAK